MKTAYKFLSILLAGSMLSSCNDLLTETPSAGYDKDTYFETVEKADMAILGIMNSISDYNHYGQDEMAMPTSDDMYFASLLNPTIKSMISRIIVTIRVTTGLNTCGA